MNDGGYAEHLNKILMQRYLDTASLAVRLEAKVVELSQRVEELEKSQDGDE